MDTSKSERIKQRDFPDLYDLEAEKGMLQNCPNCGRCYDQVDYEYQRCYHCGHSRDIANESGKDSASHVRLNALVSGKAREVAETINGSDNYMLSTDMIEHMIMVYAEQVAKAQREICAEAYCDAEGKGNDEVDRPNEGTYRHIKNAPDPAL